MQADRGRAGAVMASPSGPTGARRSGRLRRAIVGIVLGVVAVGGAAGWLVRNGRVQAGTRAADAAVVSRLSFDITTTATGELQARNQREIRSELDSESSILEIVPEGTFVRAGDIILRLNGENLQQSIDDLLPRIETARAEVVAAEKNLEIQQSENDSRIRQAQLKLDLALLSLEQWEKGERVQKEQDIALALEKTAKDLERLEEKYRQSEALYREGFLSKNELQLDEIALREARAARAKALLDDITYRQYQLPKDEKARRSDVEEARAELERVRKQAEMQLEIRMAEVASRREQLRIHERKLEKLREQLASCTVRAPQDGLVVYASSAGRNWNDEPFAVGRKVHPRESIIVLPDTSEMMAVVRVHENLAGRIRPGQRASVRIDALGGQVFEGTVDSIGVMAETQDRWRDPNRREYSIRIALGRVGTDAALKPSMRCEATITLGRVEDALAVPVQAVFSEEALRYVYVERAPGRYARVPVQIGRRSDTLAEIRLGLTGGERVLVRAPSPAEVIQEPWNEKDLLALGFTLRDGRPVPVAEQDGNGARMERRRGPGPGRERAERVGALPAGSANTATPREAAAPAGSDAAGSGSGGSDSAAPAPSPSR